MLLLMRQDYTGALRLFDLAARGHAGAGDRRTAALARLLAGDAQREAGDIAGVPSDPARRPRFADGVGDTVSEIAALVGLGALAESAGRRSRPSHCTGTDSASSATGRCRISGGGSTPGSPLAARPGRTP